MLSKQVIHCNSLLYNARMLTVCRPVVRNQCEMDSLFSNERFI